MGITPYGQRASELKSVYLFLFDHFADLDDLMKYQITKYKNSALEDYDKKIQTRANKNKLFFIKTKSYYYFRNDFIEKTRASVDKDNDRFHVNIDHIYPKSQGGTMELVMQLSAAPILIEKI